MFWNYVRITWRNLSKQKFFSSIKVGGFGIGIAACLLIALFINDELAYDKNLTNGDRIYRIVGIWDYKDTHEQGVCLPAPFANALKADYTEVEEVGRINASELFGAGSRQVRRSDRQQNFYETGVVFADQEFLNIFKMPMVYGNPKHALDESGTIVISKSKADQYFPNENPIGKTLIIDNDQSKPYRIGGVIDLPAKSHFKYDFLISLKGVEFWGGEQTNWDCYNYFTYILLRKGTNVALFESKLQEMTSKYFLSKSANDNEPKITDILSYKLQPVRDIYLKSDGIHDDLSHGDIRFVRLIGIVAIFILLIACINFINLSTAKSSNKAKEVGLRKTIGAYRSNLIRQFLSESVFYSVISFALGLLLAFLLLPFFNQIAAKKLEIPWTEFWWILPLFILISFVIGILAGIYPSFYLSSFKPISVLKGNLSRGSKNSRLRNALVIFQFSISVILIVGTLVIHKQMGYILHKKIGFDRDQVLLLHGTNTLGNQLQTFKSELLKLPVVKTVSASDYLPIGNTKRNGNQFFVEGTHEDPASGQFWQVDQDYIKTLGLHLIEGRDFFNDNTADSKSAIINQTLAKKIGLDKPIGQFITNGWGHYEVIGVVEDFHFESLRDEIAGVCIILGNSPGIISVKVSSPDMAQTISSIKATWDKFMPEQTIRYSFLDQDFGIMYTDVKRMGLIFATFSILAIIVACLGLFALSAYMIEQRTKEIGIRKVNGARIVEVTATLNKDFLTWVTFSFFIAIPIAWYTMNKWLQNFAYKTELSWWIFALAGAIALAIALFTVSWQCWRAARKNPVEALRYE